MFASVTKAQDWVVKPGTISQWCFPWTSDIMDFPFLYHSLTIFMDERMNKMEWNKMK